MTQEVPYLMEEKRPFLNFPVQRPYKGKCWWCSHLSHFLKLIYVNHIDFVDKQVIKYQITTTQSYYTQPFDLSDILNYLIMFLPAIILILHLITETRTCLPGPIPPALPYGRKKPFSEFSHSKAIQRYSTGQKGLHTP